MAEILRVPVKTPAIHQVIVEAFQTQPTTLQAFVQVFRHVTAEMLRQEHSHTDMLTLGKVLRTL